MKIRDHIEVIPQPPVVRLEHLRGADAGWISSSYYITEEADRYFKSLQVLLAKDTGCGIFLIGQYGSGKSHFLAYLTQQLERGSFAGRKAAVAPLSLLNFQAARSLESIFDQALQVEEPGQTDRRRVWERIQQRFPEGLFLIIDELSEFLRSKPSTQSFNEDLRFLQFLGEWAQDHPLWILAALQEQIEHTGDMEYDLYRKIKDRYPVRYILSPAHVKDLIAGRILRKKPSYRPAVEKLAREWMKLYPDSSVAYADLCEIYPLHPMTLELLEEVRDRFSQSRGIIDFALTRLLGNEARGVPPFLDQPWGHLITPDAIVDHFADLFEVQAEFLSVAQKVLPYFRKQIPVIFEKEAQRDLAWQLFKLLILVHLSPRRRTLEVEEAARWLLLNVSSIDPGRNREIVQRVLETMGRQGAFIKRQGTRYALDLEDEGPADLEALIARTVQELTDRGDSLFELLLPCLEQAEFNPFMFPRDRWHTRRVRWHFHERDLRVFFGGGRPAEPEEPALQIGIPWGTPAEGTRCSRILPERLELTPEILELAALCLLKERPLPARVLARVQERIAGRRHWFCSLIRAVYSNASAVDATGAPTAPPPAPAQGSHASWLNACGEWVLRQTYPMFERFAPGFGPLPREAYREYMKHAGEHDLGEEEAPDFVKLVREAYLVPMGLMQRRGSEYVVSPKLDSHELVRFLAPVLEHHPTPGRVYQCLSAPVYGLVPDQIHLLLLILLVQGEIDIVKGQHSYRDTYETLANPLQYDKIVPGRALSLNQLHDLQIICDGFGIRTPKQWSVMAQKRAIEQLRQLGRRQRDQLSGFLTKLKAQGEAEETQNQIEKVIGSWLALEKGEHELQAFEHFLFTIGSATRFVQEAGEIISLPARFERLMREAQRFRHLFGYPCLLECPNPDIASGVEALRQQPVSIAQPEALETWLDRAQSLYTKYQDWYKQEHERFWKAVSGHRMWSWRIPGLARSRHLLLGNRVQELEALSSRARSQRCPGLSNLEFQPLCRCGFEGKDAPVSETLKQFEEAANGLEQELSLFFQQERVKSKVQEWVDQGMEVNKRTLSYLEGKAGYPEVENLSLFDQHLSGVELVEPVEPEALLEFLGERAWEKSALLKALEQFLRRHGPRIVIRRDTPQPRRDLVSWCCEQALKHGIPLPSGLTLAEQKLIGSLVTPEWIGEAALCHLEDIGLPEDALVRILEMLVDGRLRPPGTAPAAGPVAAALALVNRRPPETAEELARRAATLYEQNDRLLRLRPQLWLTHLNDLADLKLDPPPAKLVELLRRHAGAQWVVIDCLGLPLLDALREMLPSCFRSWKLQSVEFGLTSQESSTDAFYRALVDGATNHSFEKINAVDELVHARKANLADLTRLARAELEIAFRKIMPRIDPGKPVVIFGDHGFRLAPDGRGFLHGGGSTLERLVPVLNLLPLP